MPSATPASPHPRQPSIPALRDPAWLPRVAWTLAALALLWPMGVLTESRPWVLLEPGALQPAIDQQVHPTPTLLGVLTTFEHDNLTSRYLIFCSRDSNATRLCRSRAKPGKAPAIQPFAAVHASHIKLALEYQQGTLQRNFHTRV